jgi:hypothetical protein
VDWPRQTLYHCLSVLGVAKDRCLFLRQSTDDWCNSLCQRASREALVGKHCQSMKERNFTKNHGADRLQRLSEYGRKNRVTIFLNGQFIIVYTGKPRINHGYSL